MMTPNIADRSFQTRQAGENYGHAKSYLGVIITNARASSQRVNKAKRLSK